MYNSQRSVQVLDKHIKVSGDGRGLTENSYTSLAARRLLVHCLQNPIWPQGAQISFYCYDQLLLSNVFDLITPSMRKSA